MAGLLSADEIFEKAKDAAVGATNADEKALQIDYEALQLKIAKWRGAISISSCPKGTKIRGGSI